MAQRAHADQPVDQKHGFPARVRRDNRRLRASSSSQHTASSTVPTLLKLGSLGTCLRKLSAEYDSVANRTGIKETCADLDRETVVSSLFESVSKEKRDRDQNVVQTLKDRQNLHKILERKAELSVRGEKLAQQKLHDAEADVEVKHWEKRWCFLLLALPTSDRVVTRTPLHLLHDVLYELFSSRLSCFSFRSLISATRSTQCRATIF